MLFLDVLHNIKKSLRITAQPCGKRNTKRKKGLSKNKQVMAAEIERREAAKKKARYDRIKTKKDHKKWLKQHKKDYIKNLKKTRPAFYWKWRITTFKLPLYIDFARWFVIDILRGKWLNPALWGIYIFVANPGEGKTISMVQHIEEKRRNNPGLKVYTNFNYKGQNGAIRCWQDIVRAPKNCIIGIDEAHLTFESNDFKNFPPEMLGELSLNRKARKQFLCSTQRYDRINKNFRDLSNYVVLCNNVLTSDRLFYRYYYNTNDYTAKFDGKKSKADFVKPFVASDWLYARYNTLLMIERLVEDVQSIEVKENELLPKLNELLEHNKDLSEKELKSIYVIRERIYTEIAEHQKQQEQKKIFDKIGELDISLRSELEKLVIA